MIVQRAKARSTIAPFGRTRGGQGHRNPNVAANHHPLLSELVNTPVDKLLEQLAEAGMSFSGPDQVVTSMEKVKLLGFLKRSHGKTETAAAEVVAPSRITLNRSRKQELTIGGGKAGVAAPAPSTWWCARRSS